MSTPSNNESSHTQATTTVHVDSVALLATALALIFVFSCLLNAAIVYLFYRRSYLQTPGNRLIFVLAVSNLVLGLIVIPINLASLVMRAWTLGVIMCFATGFFTMCVYAGSVWLVAAITLDRYYAIVRPLVYTVMLTSSYNTEIVILIWVVAFVCTLPPVFGWSTYQYSPTKSACMVSWHHHPSYGIFFFITCALLPLLVILVCYLGILKVARTSSRRVSHGNIVTDHHVKKRRRSRRTSLLVNIRMNSPTKALRTIFVTVGAVFCSWCPFVVEGIYEAVHGASGTPYWFQTSTVWLAYSMLVLNPLIYAFWNKSVRVEIIGMYFPCCPRRFRVRKDEDVIPVLPRRGSRVVSISGSVSEMNSFANSVHSRSVHQTTATGIGHNSSHDSGAILTSIEECKSDDAKPLFKKRNCVKGRKSTSFCLQEEIPDMNTEVITVADIHHDKSSAGSSRLSRSSGRKLRSEVMKTGSPSSQVDEGIVEVC